MNREGQFEVEIKPRDCYRHSVVVRQPGDTVSWTFATKKKNISFGLYYQLSSEPAPGVGRKTLGQSLSVDSMKLVKESEMMSRVPLDAQLSTDHVKEILKLAHPLVHISPPPKAGSVNTGSTESLDQPHQGTSSQQQQPSDLIPVFPVEKYASGDSTVTGSLDAPLAGTYVLVFDNTFSINTPKQLTLCVSVRRHGASDFNTSSATPTASILHGGWLLKRKRLRMQGFAKRWFKLDSTGLLTYHDDPEGPVKGGLNVKMCVITKIPPRLLMTLDSGTELFHLKALTDSDYAKWCDCISSVIHSLTALAAAGESSAGGQPQPTRRASLSQEHAILHQRILEHRISCTASMQQLKDSAKDNDDPVITQYLARLEKTFASLNSFYNDLMLLEQSLGGASLAASTAVPSSATGNQYHVDEGIEQQLDLKLQLDQQQLQHQLPIHQPPVITLPPSATPILKSVDVEDVFYDVIIMDDFEEEYELDEGDDEEDEGGSLMETGSLQPEDRSRAASIADVDAADQVQQQLAAGAHVVRLALPARATPINISYTQLIGRLSGRGGTTPVILNEPLSLLQRQCEELEYVELLMAACHASTPVDRIAHVAAFAVSCYASCVYRYDYKPFTPMLGETFEWYDVVRGFRFIAEKVEHRPDTILACHAESLDGKWSFWQELRVRTKMWGKSIELCPGGYTHVKLKSDHDGSLHEYKWNKVSSCVRNVLSRDCFVDNYGEMMISGVDVSAKIDFLKSSTDGLFSSTRTGRNELYGTILKGKQQLAKISGRWDDYLAVDERVLWKAVPPPPNSPDYYGFSLFAMQLNVLPATTDPTATPHLPPTVSRFRPDQRLLEEGDLSRADAEKARLEQRQRGRRAEMEAEGVEWEPLWFGREGAAGEYRYIGDYFEARQALFASIDFPDIF
jgi:hypothetical protein